MHCPLCWCQSRHCQPRCQWHCATVARPVSHWLKVSPQRVRLGLSSLNRTAIKDQSYQYSMSSANPPGDRGRAAVGQGRRRLKSGGLANFCEVSWRVSCMQACSAAAYSLPSFFFFYQGWIDCKCNEDVSSNLAQFNWIVRLGRLVFRRLKESDWQTFRGNILSLSWIPFTGVTLL